MSDLTSSISFKENHNYAKKNVYEKHFLLIITILCCFIYGETFAANNGSPTATGNTATSAAALVLKDLEDPIPELKDLKQDMLQNADANNNNQQSGSNNATMAGAAANAGTLSVINPNPVKDNRNENEIPVQLEATKKANSDTSLWLKMMLSVSILGIAGVGFYMWAKNQKRGSNSKNQMTQIKILAQSHLGPKKSLAVVRVAGESILIGITDQNINLLKPLSLLDEEIPDEVPNHFGNAFGQMLNDGKMDHEGHDEFSIAGIKDVVQNRIKSFRG